MNSHNRNKIEILKDFLERDVRNPLEMFSLFVTSNPDYKYNITYLTDQIKSFKESRLELKNRFIQFEEIVKRIRKLTPKEISGYLIFDKIFKYGVNINEDDHLEFINLDSYRFDKIDSKNYIVRFILGDKKDPEKIETYRIDRETNTDIESKIAIKKLWSSFINKKS